LLHFYIFRVWGCGHGTLASHPYATGRGAAVI